MHRRRTDQSRLHQIAVSPVVSLATLGGLAVAILGGGIAWGTLATEVGSTKQSISRHEAEISVAKNRAEQASSDANTNRAVLQRMENYMQEMRRDIKTLIRESRGDG